MKLLILNGPNLNLLGQRETEIYGTFTLEQLCTELSAYTRDTYPEIQLDFFQSNHEGELVEKLHAAPDTYSGIIFNPAAYTHYSIALRDAIAAIDVPVIEVHISNPDQREDFRKVNVIRDVCINHFQGKGIQSYKEAIDYLESEVT